MKTWVKENLENIVYIVKTRKIPFGDFFAALSGRGMLYAPHFSNNLSLYYMCLVIEVRVS